VIERCQCLRFAFEARHVLRIVGQRRGQYFDGDVAIQLAVARAIYLAHAARTDRCDDFIRAETVAG
jgi:hypothetical protein